MATPSREEAIRPNPVTHTKVSHRPPLDGRSTPNAAVPIASSTAVSAQPTTATMMTLPMKYETAGIGVPARRLRVPSSRSPAMVTPRARKLVDAMPAEIMPATKTC